MKKLLSISALVFISNLLSAQCVPLADYTFNGDANDQSGNGYNATVYGATLTTDRFGNPNSAYEFNGTSDYIDTQTSFDYQDRTVSVWAMAYDTSSIRRILDQNANSLNYGAFTTVYMNGDLLGNAGGEGGNQILPTPTLNAWYHIVLVRNATTTKIYVNGTLTHTGTPSSNGSSAYPNPQLVIGTMRSKDDQFFSGKIDDIQIYNCELTAAQIDSLYNLPNTSNCTPVANYTFDGDANDHSGNGYNATNYGATLTTDRFGTPNSAYEFNGISDYMDTQSTFDFQERTVSMWAMAYDTSSIRRILDQNANSLNYGAFTAAYINGDLLGNAGGEGGNQILSTPILNQWYHIVLARNATTTKIYVNGTLTHTGIPTSNGSADYPNPQLVIGTNRRKIEQFFNGKIDDIQIYNCELNQSDIDSLYGNYNLYLGKANLVRDNIKVYPNPMSDIAVVKFNNKDQSSCRLTLTDQQGRIVKEIRNISGNQISIEKGNLANGIYFLQISNYKNIIANSKLIIE